MEKENEKKQVKVTQSKIKNDELENGIYKIDRCLYLRVRKPYKSWFIKTQINGKRKEIALCSASKVSMAVAKTRAIKLLADLSEGIVDFNDPKGKKSKDDEPVIHLFKDVAAEAIENTANMRKWKGTRTRQQWYQITRDFLTPKIGNMDIRDIGLDEIIECLAEPWDRIPPTAKKIREKAERIFEYATLKGWYDKPNPARWKGNLDILLPSVSKIHEEHHHDALTFSDAQRIAKKFYQSPYISHKFTLFGMLVPARVSEYRFARWDEIDFEAKTFTIPASRKKTDKTDYVVPLCEQAISILKSIDRVSDYIFWNPVKEKLLTVDTPRQTLNRNSAYHVTMHGMRATFRDWAVRECIDDKVAEKVLSHVWGTKVTRAYMRSDLFEERKVVMQQWADALLGEDDGR